MKHGKKAHLFEAIHQLPIDVGQPMLDEYEKLYISAYREAGAIMLNMTKGGKGGRPTEEIIIKLRSPKSDQHRANISAAVKKQWELGIKKPFTKHTEESKRKSSLSKMGHFTSEETRRKIGDGNRGKGPNSTCFAKGENLKFTADQIVTIRSKYKFRVYTALMLAAEFNTSRDTIGDIIKRKIYTHI